MGYRKNEINASRIHATLESTSVYYTRGVECMVYDSYMHELAESAGFLGPPPFPGKKCRSRTVKNRGTPHEAQICQRRLRSYQTSLRDGNSGSGAISDVISFPKPMLACAGRLLRRRSPLTQSHPTQPHVFLETKNSKTRISFVSLLGSVPGDQGPSP